MAHGGEHVKPSRYWGRYRLVLVTNARDFVLLGEDAHGKPATLETLRLGRQRGRVPQSSGEAAHAFARDSLARALASTSHGRCRTARR